MASSSSAPPGDTSPGCVRIRVMSPGSDVPPNFFVDIPESATVDELKLKIQAGLDAKPAPDHQRLIYRGKVLDGAATVRTAVIGVSPEAESYTIHLVIRPAAAPPQPNPQPQSSAAAAPTAPAPPSLFQRNQLFAGVNTPAAPITTTTTTSTYRSGANVVRTTTRISSSVSGSLADALPPFPGGVPPTLRPGITPEVMRGIEERVNEQFRNIMAARSNAGSSPGIPAGLNLTGLRGRHSENREDERASLMDRFGIPPQQTTSQEGTPSIAGSQIPRNTSDQNYGAASSSADPAEARRRALQASLEEMPEEGQQTPQPAPLPTLPPHFISTPIPTGPAPIIIPPNSSLYLLQDPQGRPHSLLVGPPNSANLQPAAMGIPSVFAPPPLLPHPPIHQQIHHGQEALGHQLELLRRELELLDARHNRLRDPANLAAGGVAPGAAPINPPGVALAQAVAQMRGGVHHMWLAIKLAIFVFLFSGQGGLGRVIYLSTMALGIFIWQTGLHRHIFNILFPAPPRTPPVLPHPNQQQNPNEPDPARTAQMLIQRRENGSRRAFRMLERSVGLFIASLVPGLHERHVQNVEQQQAQQQRMAEAQEQQQGDGPQQQQQQPVPVGQAEGPPNANDEGLRERRPAIEEIGHPVGLGGHGGIF